MKHASLFSGIGGFDLAAEWMGWQNVFHCEIDKFCQSVLKYYWPKSILYGDIKKTDFTIYKGTIDILTGGFPCQPYSTAGKRLGKEDDRHLWPEMLRAICEIRPRYVVGENVRGIINWNGGMVFDEVQADLEAAGYEVWPFVLPACALNAPHRRDRVWFISRLISNPGEDGCNWHKKSKKRRESDGFGFSFDVINTLSCIGTSTNADSKGLQIGFQSGFGSIQKKKRTPQGCEFTRSYTKEYWSKFPTQSPICSGNDGLSERLDGITIPKWRRESLKAYGNAIVPQVAFEIFKAIEDIKNKLD